TAMTQSFIFNSSVEAKRFSTRKTHIRRLYDVMEICLQRGDFARAARAWAILARCEEIKWKKMWVTGLQLLGPEPNKTTKKIEFLRVMMLQQPEERESILQELVLHLIASGEHREALDELELYLPSFPYQDNPALHVYAGLLCLFLAQPGELSTSLDPSLLRDAQSHLERALALDTGNVVAQGFLFKIRSLSGNNANADAESDEEDLPIHTRNAKRPRT
ncbi:unnamed protein product, partial [Mycena citricolor]